MRRGERRHAEVPERRELERESERAHADDVAQGVPLI